MRRIGWWFENSAARAKKIPHLRRWLVWRGLASSRLSHRGEGDSFAEPVTCKAVAFPGEKVWMSMSVSTILSLISLASRFGHPLPNSSSGLD